MKILTKQKQREIEKRITANAIIANNAIHTGFVTDSIDHYAENMYIAMYLLGGEGALDRMVNTLNRYLHRKSSNKKGGSI